jgi:phosphopantothenoylcysteine decarboxylase/phosphopantothenate--cysteine ligase
LILHNKNILMGITGSIAAYKSCLVLRQLQELGADIRVIMTDSAQKFLGKSTLETLTLHPVYTNLFPDDRSVTTEHVRLAEWADVILVCPATANSIGKIASGIADDLLTTTILASRASVIFAPAMDTHMFENPIFKANCDRLTHSGYRVLGTDSGHLASGLTGSGRLLDPLVIVDSVRKACASDTNLAGQKILVSAGPTREYLDAVRYISNPSSAKMGIAMAEEAYLRGSEVMLVCGPTSNRVMDGVRIFRVETAGEMSDCISRHWENHDILVMTAAVSDYRPKTRFPGKIKKEADSFSVELTRTTDILAEAAKTKNSRLLVGFALETEPGIENALEKVQKKNLDLICLNHLDSSEAVFGSDTIQITLVEPSGAFEELPKMTKTEASQRIWDKIETLLRIG